MGKFLDSKRISGVVISSAASILVVALVAYGSTTISTSINTGGNLTVSGTATLADATLSSTLSVTGNATFDTNTFYVDATNNKVGVLTAAPNTAFEVVGSGTAATSASTTSLIVGGYGTNNTPGGKGIISGLMFGTCNLTAATVTASSTKTFYCNSATGVRAGDTVFMAATSSLIVGAFNDQYLAALTGAASSTVSGRIDVDIMVVITGASRTIAGTLNFWAVR